MAGSSVIEHQTLSNTPRLADAAGTGKARSVPVAFIVRHLSEFIGSASTFAKPRKGVGSELFLISLLLRHIFHSVMPVRKSALGKRTPSECEVRQGGSKGRDNPVSCRAARRDDVMTAAPIGRPQKARSKTEPNRMPWDFSIKHQAGKSSSDAPLQCGITVIASRRVRHVCETRPHVALPWRDRLRNQGHP